MWGFFFWLDIVSTFTLLFDVGWVRNFIFGIDDDDTGDADIWEIGSSATQIAKAARATKIGARAGRIVRIIRLVRLVQIIKIYKNITVEADGVLEDDDRKSKAPKFDIISGKRIIR